MTPSMPARPPALPVGGLGFDVDRETLVLFGGYTPITHVVLSQTWEWNAAWIDQPTGRYPIHVRQASKRIIRRINK